MLAAIKLRDYKQAQALWLRLTDNVQKDAPASRLARLLGVELKLAQNDGAGALRLLQSGESVQAKASRAELFLAAQAQLQLNPTAPATEVRARPVSGLAATTQSLQTWVADHPTDAQAWQLLSSSYAAEGLTLSSIRAPGGSQCRPVGLPRRAEPFQNSAGMGAQRRRWHRPLRGIHRRHPHPAGGITG